MEGYDVQRLDDVIETADVIITATGNRDIVTLDQMRRMKHNAVLGNIGHFDNEIDMAGLQSRAEMSSASTSSRRSTSGSSRTARRSSSSPRAGCSTSATPPAIRAS